MNVNACVLYTTIILLLLFNNKNNNNNYNKLPSTDIFTELEDLLKSLSASHKYSPESSVVARIIVKRWLSIKQLQIYK